MPIPSAKVRSQLPRERKIKSDFPEWRCHAGGARTLRVVNAGGRHNEAFFHTKDGIGIEVGVAGDEQVGDDGTEAWCSDDEVNVRRPIGMASRHFQHLADRSVVGNWIRRRLDRRAPIAAVDSCGEHSAQIERRLLWILYIVKSRSVLSAKRPVSRR